MGLGRERNDVPPLKALEGASERLSQLPDADIDTFYDTHFGGALIKLEELFEMVGVLTAEPGRKFNESVWFTEKETHVLEQYGFSLDDGYAWTGDIFELDPEREEFPIGRVIVVEGLGVAGSVGLEVCLMTNSDFLEVLERERKEGGLLPGREDQLKSLRPEIEA